MVDSVKDLDRLLSEEKAALLALMDSWQSAKDSQDWIEADRLRGHVKYWDTNLLCQDGLWHPQFEHPINRQRRAFLRMARYKINVYPWRLDE